MQYCNEEAVLRLVMISIERCIAIFYAVYYN